MFATQSRATPAGEPGTVEQELLFIKIKLGTHRGSFTLILRSVKHSSYTNVHLWHKAQVLLIQCWHLEVSLMSHLWVTVTSRGQSFFTNSHNMFSR